MGNGKTTPCFHLAQVMYWYSPYYLWMAYLWSAVIGISEEEVHLCLRVPDWNACRGEQQS